jgi:type II secretory pathway pseudopilin PulG
MLVTLIIISSLLAGAVVLVSMQLASNRSTDLSRSSVTALYCAEAGLHAARLAVGAAASTDLDAAVAASAAGTTTEPAWLTTAINANGDHDVNGDNAGPDFHVYLKDNDDEVVNSVTNNLADDIDNKVWVVSVCDPYPETPQSVSELLSIPVQVGKMYDWQSGGAFGNNNYNFMQVTQ